MGVSSGTSVQGFQTVIDGISGELGTIDLLINDPDLTKIEKVGYFWAGRMPSNPGPFIICVRGIVYSQGIIVDGAGIRSGPYPLVKMVVNWSVEGLSWHTFF